jgi:hypothetical protein
MKQKHAHFCFKNGQAITVYRIKAVGAGAPKACWSRFLGG